MTKSVCPWFGISDVRTVVTWSEKKILRVYYGPEPINEWDDQRGITVSIPDSSIGTT